eukprot:m.208122 g.208122  ORF g.208122 m.208122 type:complete len:464 (+) comp15038_c2_seq8:288-1679(+)
MGDSYEDSDADKTQAQAAWLNDLTASITSTVETIQETRPPIGDVLLRLNALEGAVQALRDADITELNECETLAAVATSLACLRALCSQTRVSQQLRLESDSVDQRVNKDSVESSTQTSADGSNVEERTDTQSDDLQTKEEKARSKAIDATVLNPDDSPEKHGFVTVVGHDAAKSCLREAVVLAWCHPQLFQGIRQPWTRILLYGPPGTGKTKLARAVAAEISGTFYCVSSADLISSWVGESEKLIRELFQRAAQQDEHAVIFIDEVDSLCRKRNAGEDDSARRIKTELLRQMEGVDTLKASRNVFLLCATNCPWELDSAFIRRFQKRVFVGLPSTCERQLLLTKLLETVPHSLSSEQLEELGKETDGYSGSDIANIVADGVMEPVRELQMATHWQCRTDGTHCAWEPCDPSASGAFQGSLNDIPQEEVATRKVHLSDMTKALRAVQPTVSQEQLMRFQQYHKP